MRIFLYRPKNVNGGDLINTLVRWAAAAGKAVKEMADTIRKAPETVEELLNEVQRKIAGEQYHDFQECLLRFLQDEISENDTAA